MPDASFFREKAQRCRELAEIAIRPEVREQLRVWAEEFAGLAQAKNPRHAAVKREPEEDWGK